MSTLGKLVGGAAGIRRAKQNDSWSFGWFQITMIVMSQMVFGRMHLPGWQMLVLSMLVVLGAWGLARAVHSMQTRGWI